MISWKYFHSSSTIFSRRGWRDNHRMKESARRARGSNMNLKVQACRRTRPQGDERGGGGMTKSGRLAMKRSASKRAIEMWTLGMGIRTWRHSTYNYQEWENLVHRGWRMKRIVSTKRWRNGWAVYVLYAHINGNAGLLIVVALQKEKKSQYFVKVIVRKMIAGFLVHLLVNAFSLWL